MSPFVPNPKIFSLLSKGSKKKQKIFSSWIKKFVTFLHLKAAQTIIRTVGASFSN